MMAVTVNEPQNDVLEACRRGDQDALRVLFEAHKDRVYSLALRFTGDGTAAWDVTQEVFIKVFSKLREFRNQSKFETWLYRIVLNACIDEQRRNKRFVPFAEHHQHNQISEDQPQEKSYVRRQVTEAVQQAVARLSPKVKAPILLRYVEGLSYTEIAEALGCRAGTVAARLNRGHKILARELAGLRGVTP
jgi:RNA polymerase sigma-70 factor, ECF subfamily